MLPIFNLHRMKNYRKLLSKDLQGINPSLFVKIPLFVYDPVSSDSKVCMRKLYTPELLLQGEKAWLIGSAEMGKTTFFRALMLTLLNVESDDHAPFYVNLTDLYKSQQRFFDYICAVFQKYGYEHPQKFIQKQLEEGNFIILLDGLDEFHNLSMIHKVIETINQFLKDYNSYKNTILIACRDTRYWHLLPTLGKIYLQELNAEQIETAINTQKNLGANSKAYLQLLVENPHLSQMARTPFGLANIYHVYRMKNEAPVNLSDLYKGRVLQALEDTAHECYNLDTQKHLLEEMAFFCHNQRQIWFSEGEFCQTANSAMPSLNITPREAEVLLKTTLGHTGLIVNENQLYRFSNLALQEFLAAQKLAGKIDGIRFILSKHNDSWWHNPIAFYAGLLNNPSGLIISLNEVNSGLAMKCYTEAKKVNSDLHEVLQNILRQKLNLNQDDEQNVEIINRTIIYKADMVTVDFIREQILNGASPDTKMRGAQLLGEIGSEQSLRILEDLSRNAAANKSAVLGYNRVWRRQ